MLEQLKKLEATALPPPWEHWGGWGLFKLIHRASNTVIANGTYDIAGELGFPGPEASLLIELRNAAPALLELIDSAEELVEILNDGEYVPDSVTIQPLAVALAALKGER